MGYVYSVGKTKITWRRAIPSGLILGLLLQWSCATGAETLAQIKAQYRLGVDVDAVSISGLSAGAWMAVQYHITHNSDVMGVASVAGGPYHCAGTSSFLCDYAFFFMPADSCQAMYICSATADKLLPMGFYWGPPDHDKSIDSALEQISQGNADPLETMQQDRIWIFTSGREDVTPHDTMVPHDVAVELNAFYESLSQSPGVNFSGEIAFIDSIQAEHGFLVDNASSADNCDFFGSPFINDCSYSTAGELLNFIYPNRPTEATPAAGELISFEQAAVAEATMAENGHIYIPASCVGSNCPLHIALHGCGQHQDQIDANTTNGNSQYFFRDSGYNPWADQHGVLILYPQVAPSGDNPYGCWDWWGYSGKNYFQKSAPQQSAIDSMVGCLKDDGC